MMDLTGEVSSGAVDMAKSNLEKMLTLCATPLVAPTPPTSTPSGLPGVGVPPSSTSNDEAEQRYKELKAIQEKSLYEVTHELVRQVTSPNTYVREQAMSSLKLLASIRGVGIVQVMEPHKEVLQDMIPPKKHLLRHQPVNAQIGLMDGNTFCTTLEPRLFTIDCEFSHFFVTISRCYISRISCSENHGAQGFLHRVALPVRG